MKEYRFTIVIKISKLLLRGELGLVDGFTGAFGALDEVYEV